jgi:hypothetical protein
MSTVPGLLPLEFCMDILMISCLQAEDRFRGDDGAVPRGKHFQ